MSDDPTRLLAQASGLLTRYRTEMGGSRNAFDDLTMFEWIGSILPQYDTADSVEYVMRKATAEGVHLWDGKWSDHAAQSEMERVYELLDELGYQSVDGEEN